MRHQPRPHTPITKELVLEAALACIAAGMQPSQRQVIARIGGSHSTIGRHLRMLRANGSLTPGKSVESQVRPALAYCRSVIELFQTAVAGIQVDVHGKVDISTRLAPIEHLLPTLPDERTHQRSDTRYVIPEIQDTATEELP